MSRINWIWNWIRNRIRHRVRDRIWNRVRNRIGDRVWYRIGDRVRNWSWKPSGVGTLRRLNGDALKIRWVAASADGAGIAAGCRRAALGAVVGYTVAGLILRRVRDALAVVRRLDVTLVPRNAVLVRSAVAAIPTDRQLCTGGCGSRIRRWLGCRIRTSSCGRCRGSRTSSSSP